MPLPSAAGAADAQSPGAAARQLRATHLHPDAAAAGGSVGGGFAGGVHPAYAATTGAAGAAGPSVCPEGGVRPGTTMWLQTHGIERNKPSPIDPSVDPLVRDSLDALKADLNELFGVLRAEDAEAERRRKSEMQQLNLDAYRFRAGSSRSPSPSLPPPPEYVDDDATDDAVTSLPEARALRALGIEVVLRTITSSSSSKPTTCLVIRRVAPNSPAAAWGFADHVGAVIAACDGRRPASRAALADLLTTPAAAAAGVRGATFVLMGGETREEEGGRGDDGGADTPAVVMVPADALRALHARHPQAALAADTGVVFAKWDTRVLSVAADSHAAGWGLSDVVGWRVVACGGAPIADGAALAAALDDAWRARGSAVLTLSSAGTDHSPRTAIEGNTEGGQMEEGQGSDQHRDIACDEVHGRQASAQQLLLDCLGLHVGRWDLVIRGRNTATPESTTLACRTTSGTSSGGGKSTAAVRWGLSEYVGWRVDAVNDTDAVASCVDLVDAMLTPGVVVERLTLSRPREHPHTRTGGAGAAVLGTTLETRTVAIDNDDLLDCCSPHAASEFLRQCFGMRVGRFNVAVKGVDAGSLAESWGIGAHVGWRVERCGPRQITDSTSLAEALDAATEAAEAVARGGTTTTFLEDTARGESLAIVFRAPEGSPHTTATVVLQSSELREAGTWEASGDRASRTVLEQTYGLVLGQFDLVIQSVEPDSQAASWGLVDYLGCAIQSVSGRPVTTLEEVARLLQDAACEDPEEDAESGAGATPCVLHLAPLPRRPPGAAAAAGTVGDDDGGQRVKPPAATLLDITGRVMPSVQVFSRGTPQTSPGLGPRGAPSGIASDDDEPDGAIEDSLLAHDDAVRPGGPDDTTQEFRLSQQQLEKLVPLTLDNLAEKIRYRGVAYFGLRRRDPGDRTIVEYGNAVLVAHAAAEGTTGEVAVTVTLRDADGAMLTVNFADMLDPRVRLSCIATGGNAASVLEWLDMEWQAKNGTLLTELEENLITPDASPDGSSRSREQQRQEIRTRIHRIGKVLKRRTGLRYTYPELFVMTLYTMAGPDIDQVMGFDDVPQDCSLWGTAYTSRNAAMFSTVNSALRAAGTAQDWDANAWPFSELRKWVKTIALLAAVGVHEKLAPTQDPHELSRGLAGLPEAVVDDHKTLFVGDRLIWTAPSSCALDPAVSMSYIEGTATNAMKSKGGAVLFQIRSGSGLPLQAVSKYPKEAEVLLPPFTELVLEGIRESAKVPGCLVFDAKTSVALAETRGGLWAAAREEAATLDRVLKQSDAFEGVWGSLRQKTKKLRVLGMMLGAARRMSALPAGAMSPRASRRGSVLAPPGGRRSSRLQKDVVLSIPDVTPPPSPAAIAALAALGVEVRVTTSASRPAAPELTITSIAHGSPAAGWGLSAYAGYTLVGCDGAPITSVDALADLLTTPSDATPCGSRTVELREGELEDARTSASVVIPGDALHKTHAHHPQNAVAADTGVVFSKWDARVVSVAAGTHGTGSGLDEVVGWRVVACGGAPVADGAELAAALDDAWRGGGSSMRIREVPLRVVSDTGVEREVVLADNGCRTAAAQRVMTGDLGLSIGRWDTTVRDVSDGTAAARWGLQEYIGWRVVQCDTIPIATAADLDAAMAAAATSDTTTPSPAYRELTLEDTATGRTTTINVPAKDISYRKSTIEQRAAEATYGITFEAATSTVITAAEEGRAGDTWGLGAYVGWRITECCGCSIESSADLPRVIDTTCVGAEAGASATITLVSPDGAQTTSIVVDAAEAQAAGASQGQRHLFDTTGLMLSRYNLRVLTVAKGSLADRSGFAKYAGWVVEKCDSERVAAVAEVIDAVFPRATAAATTAGSVTGSTPPTTPAWLGGGGGGDAKVLSQSGSFLPAGVRRLRSGSAAAAAGARRDCTMVLSSEEGARSSVVRLRRSDIADSQRGCGLLRPASGCMGFGGGSGGGVPSATTSPLRTAAEDAITRMTGVSISAYDSVVQSVASDTPAARAGLSAFVGWEVVVCQGVSVADAASLAGALEGAAVAGTPSTDGATAATPPPPTALFVLRDPATGEIHTRDVAIDVDPSLPGGLASGCAGGSGGALLLNAAPSQRALESDMGLAVSRYDLAIRDVADGTPAAAWGLGEYIGWTVRRCNDGVVGSCEDLADALGQAAATQGGPGDTGVVELALQSPAGRTEVVAIQPAAIPRTAPHRQRDSLADALGLDVGTWDMAINDVAEGTRAEAWGLREFVGWRIRRCDSVAVRTCGELTEALARRGSPTAAGGANTTAGAAHDSPTAPVLLELEAPNGELRTLKVQPDPEEGGLRKPSSSPTANGEDREAEEDEEEEAFTTTGDVDLNTTSESRSPSLDRPRRALQERVGVVLGGRGASLTIQNVDAGTAAARCGLGNHVGWTVETVGGEVVTSCVGFAQALERATLAQSVSALDAAYSTSSAPRGGGTTRPQRRSSVCRAPSTSLAAAGVEVVLRSAATNERRTITITAAELCDGTPEASAALAADVGLTLDRWSLAITAVARGSPAWGVGLQECVGWRVAEWDGVAVTSVVHLGDLVSRVGVCVGNEAPDGPLASDNQQIPLLLEHPSTHAQQHHSLPLGPLVNALPEHLRVLRDALGLRITRWSNVIESIAPRSPAARFGLRDYLGWRIVACTGDGSGGDISTDSSSTIAGVYSSAALATALDRCAWAGTRVSASGNDEGARGASQLGVTLTLHPPPTAAATGDGGGAAVGATALPLQRLAKAGEATGAARGEQQQPRTLAVAPAAAAAALAALLTPAQRAMWECAGVALGRWDARILDVREGSAGAGWLLNEYIDWALARYDGERVGCVDEVIHAILDAPVVDTADDAAAGDARILLLESPHGTARVAVTITPRDARKPLVSPNTAVLEAIGVTLRAGSAGPNGGVVLESVAPGAPAERWGWGQHLNAVITHCDDATVERPQDLVAALMRKHDAATNTHAPVRIGVATQKDAGVGAEARDASTSASPDAVVLMRSSRTLATARYSPPTESPVKLTSRAVALANPASSSPQRGVTASVQTSGDVTHIVDVVTCRTQSDAGVQVRVCVSPISDAAHASDMFESPPAGAMAEPQQPGVAEHPSPPRCAYSRSPSPVAMADRGARGGSASPSRDIISQILPYRLSRVEQRSPAAVAVVAASSPGASPIRVRSPPSLHTSVTISPTRVPGAARSPEQRGVGASVLLRATSPGQLLQPQPQPQQGKPLYMNRSHTPRGGDLGTPSQSPTRSPSRSATPQRRALSWTPPRSRSPVTVPRSPNLSPSRVVARMLARSSRVGSGVGATLGSTTTTIASAVVGPRSRGGSPAGVGAMTPPRQAVSVELDIDVPHMNITGSTSRGRNGVSRRTLSRSLSQQRPRSRERGPPAPVAHPAMSQSSQSLALAARIRPTGYLPDTFFSVADIERQRALSQREFDAMLTARRRHWRETRSVSVSPVPGGSAAAATTTATGQRSPPHGAASYLRLPAASDAGSQRRGPGQGHLDGRATPATAAPRPRAASPSMSAASQQSSMLADLIVRASTRSTAKAGGRRRSRSRSRSASPHQRPTAASRRQASSGAATDVLVASLEELRARERVLQEKRRGAAAAALQHEFYYDFNVSETGGDAGSGPAVSAGPAGVATAASIPPRTGAITPPEYGPVAEGAADVRGPAAGSTAGASPDDVSTTGTAAPEVPPVVTLEDLCTQERQLQERRRDAMDARKRRGSPLAKLAARAAAAAVRNQSYTTTATHNNNNSNSSSYYNMTQSTSQLTSDFAAASAGAGRLGKQFAGYGGKVVHTHPQHAMAGGRVRLMAREEALKKQRDRSSASSRAVSGRGTSTTGRPKALTRDTTEDLYATPATSPSRRAPHYRIPGDDGGDDGHASVALQCPYYVSASLFFAHLRHPRERHAHMLKRKQHAQIVTLDEYRALAPIDAQSFTAWQAYATTPSNAGADTLACMLEELCDGAWEDGRRWDFFAFMKNVRTRLRAVRKAKSHQEESLSAFRTGTGGKYYT